MRRRDEDEKSKEHKQVLTGKGEEPSMLHLPRMRTALTVVTALASRLTKEAGMRSYLAVPVDKEMKYESTSPPLSTSSFERLLASVPRVPECGAIEAARNPVRARGSQRTSVLG